MITAPRLSARDLWHQLQSDAGLELRLKGGKPGRDADLDSAVLADLVARISPTTSAKTVDALLRSDAKSKRPRITSETLLVAVLTSQRGFAAMMEDILETLITAQAKVPERPLSMQFEFDSVSGPIRQTLNEFRAAVKKNERVLARVFELPNSDRRWKLWQDLQTLMPSDSEKRNARFDLPQILPTGHGHLDGLMAELCAMVSVFQSACLRYGDNRTDVIRTVLDLHSGGRDLEEREHGLARDASDYWDADVLSSLQGIANAVVVGSVDAEPTAERLGAALFLLSRRHEWISRTYNDLLDILNLPTWRKRNELYSVWVGTALLRAAKRCASDLRFHAVNGVLSFSFAGKRLATYDWNGAQFDIWCELRSALAGSSKKRKKGIQPDFRVVESTMSIPIAAATRFILECKHYLGYSVTNFAMAANDYARSCPNASVFIVNHGPAEHDSLIQSVDSAVASNVAFHGNVTADTRIRPHPLEFAIQKALFPLPAMAPLTPDSIAPIGQIASPAQGQCLIRLSWTEALNDLDLALEIFDQNGWPIDRIDYRNKCGAITPSLARLLDDHRSGPGEEVIEINRWGHASYVVSVTNYSETGEMQPGDLHCLVTIDGKDVRIDPPTSITNSHFWQVAHIDVATRHVNDQGSAVA